MFLLYFHRKFVSYLNSKTSQTNFDKTVQFVFNPPSTNTTDLTEGLGYNAKIVKEKEEIEKKYQPENQTFNKVRPLCVPVKFVNPKPVLKTSAKIEETIKVDLSKDNQKKVKQVKYD